MPNRPKHYSTDGIWGSPSADTLLRAKSIPSVDQTLAEHPPETAPTDGTPFLAYGEWAWDGMWEIESDVSAPRWGVCATNDHRGEGFWSLSENPYVDEVRMTKWRYLPDAEGA